MKNQPDVTHNQVELVLIRGLPGSGKSTLARKMRGHKRLEADMYFMRDGKYNYDVTKIARAQAWCLRKAKAALARGISVVIANTFVKRWEMEPYEKLGYPLRVIVATGQYASKHDVPAEKMQRLRDNWEA